MASLLGASECELGVRPPVGFWPHPTADGNVECFARRPRAISKGPLISWTQIVMHDGATVFDQWLLAHSDQLQNSGRGSDR